MAVIAYAIQVYCDFSGYTDMALGAAHMLGYKLAPNFNLPFLAANIADFWRRWHISLSSWLRDYVFIPLGGSRGSERPWRRRWLTGRNLLITMSLGGLWHGACWTLVAFGAIHGIYLIIHRGFRSWCAHLPRLSALLQSLPGTVLRIAMTFTCFCLSLIVFRSTTFAIAGTMFKHLFTNPVGLKGPPLHPIGFNVTVALVAICHLLALCGPWKKVVARLPAPMVGFGYATVLILALLLAPSSGKAFIYFQF
jgi:alginate O-acetyltransferase complex protein AlgI